tara:strand:+ start:43 stop:804 length:762 start_codon:yes stop_codon:yes gene_type:complete
MFEIGIPSFNRPKIIDYTLDLLKYYKIDKKIITIFLEDETQLELYSNHDYKKIITHTKGYGNKMEYIKNHYDNNTNLVIIDDDIEQLLEMIDKKTGKQLENLTDFLENAFSLLREKKYFMFGIYPVNNYFFMKKETTEDLKFCCGGFMGYIVRKNDEKLRWDEYEIKSDYVWTIQHYLKDGGLLRFNHITIKTKTYLKRGGCFSMYGDRMKISEKVSDEIQKRFPKYVSKRIRKNGMWEIRLKGGRKKKIIIE